MKGFKWKKLKILLPTAALFAAPWMHKVIFLNMTTAWPDMPVDVAHFVGLIGAVACFFATAFIVDTHWND